MGQFSKGELRQTVLFVPDEFVDLKTDTRSNNKYLLDEARLIVSVEYETLMA